MPPKVSSHFSNFFCIGLGPPTTKLFHASSSLTNLPNTPSLLHHRHSHRDPNLHQMNSQNLPWFPFLPFLSFLKLLLLFQFHLSSSFSDQYFYTDCSNTFTCGSITKIGYPFRGTGDQEYCGYPGLVLDCSNDNITTIQIKNLTYRVLGIDQSGQTMKIAREDLMESTCPHYLVNTTLDSALFEYTSSTYMNLTFLYGCQVPLKPVLNLIPIPSCNESGNVYLFAGAQGGDLIGCQDSVVTPISGWVLPVNSTDQEQAIRGGFEVKWKVDSKECSDCIGSKGRCGYSFLTNQTTCYCPTPPYVWDTCSVAAGETPPGSTNRFNMGIKLTIAFSIIVAVTCLITVIFCLKRRFTSSANAVAFSKKACMDDRNVEAFLRNCGSLAPKRYRYLDLKKITSSFKDKLGQGGYGSVYKGKLSDGRLVAVKVLSQTEGNGQEFINEVASISITSHINVVTLLGFCFETKRRALIYEFMANGSLDKFICNDESVNTNCRLEWSTLYQIAVGIARGLEYLHRGCSTRIVHFDIKPHNILLDEDLRPKISDFGLAKLCQTKQSVISMLGARGTAGYIAPEVFSRTFGQVSHKSDVYSYGMMVLEMTGARDQKLGVVQTSEKYFPHWIYEHLEHDRDLSLHGVITTTEEEETVRKMILVGLWCIQTNPSDRPPMSKVVEMLEGSLQSLQIPPKPYLFPPTRANPSTQDTSNSL